MTYVVLLLWGLCVPAVMAQSPAQALSILDKTAEMFRKAGGVQADFKLSVTSGRYTQPAVKGTILLQGDKFVVNTPDIITWFDGKTQWSYVVANEEVNVSYPTAQELEQINPYAFLSLYRKGYVYRMGGVTRFKGKKAWEVMLTSVEPKQMLQDIRLLVDRSSYQLLSVELRRKGEQESTTIEVTKYITHQHYADDVFIFSKKSFPQAEIIDLR